MGERDEHPPDVNHRKPYKDAQIWPAKLQAQVHAFHNVPNWLLMAVSRLHPLLRPLRLPEHPPSPFLCPPAFTPALKSWHALVNASVCIGSAPLQLAQAFFMACLQLPWAGARHMRWPNGHLGLWAPKTVHTIILSIFAISLSVATFHKFFDCGEMTIDLCQRKLITWAMVLLRGH